MLYLSNKMTADSYQLFFAKISSFKMDYRKPNYAGFIAIASGPAGGSLTSLQEALEILLEGACYNFQQIEEDNIVEKLHWKKVFDKKVADKEWVNFLFKAEPNDKQSDFSLVTPCSFCC